MKKNHFNSFKQVMGNSMLKAVVLLVAVLFFNSCKKDSESPGRAPTSGQLREYFIAADEVEWNYSPSVDNLFTMLPYTPEELEYLVNDTNRIGRKNIKAIYRLYTDASFTTLLPTIDDAEKGMLGPVIRAEVGDRIKVVFRNQTQYPQSMHPHGVHYDTDSEGIIGIDPGDTHIYIWDAFESSGPAINDGSSVSWIYHSHVMDHMGMDIYAGLVGPLIIYKKGFLKNNKAADVDAEKFAFFCVMDENTSLYLDSNITHYTTSPFIDKEDDEFIESNLKHSINGLMFGNQHYTMNTGQKVRWYLSALGNEVDWHTAHWHGNTVIYSGHRTDVISLGPASMGVADMRAENPGTWQYHCHVHDHMMAGMDALYTVQ